MQTREYTTIDKSTWGVGQWQSEPDKRQWKDPDTGLPCLIVRNPRGGNLCGYVGVSKDHPAHGLAYSHWGYDDLGNALPRSATEAAINDITVHGGLTYADGCAHGGDESRGICHIPGDGEPDDVWWFGFDCAHAGNISPGYQSRYPEHFLNRDETYRNIFYVEAECRSLARQLALMAAAQPATAMATG